MVLFVTCIIVERRKQMLWAWQVADERDAEQVERAAVQEWKERGEVPTKARYLVATSVAPADQLEKMQLSQYGGSVTVSTHLLPSLEEERRNGL